MSSAAEERNFDSHQFFNFLSGYQFFNFPSGSFEATATRQHSCHQKAAARYWDRYKK